MPSPFAFLPLDYLIARDAAAAAPGHVLELGYDTAAAPSGPWILYGNLRDQEGNRSFGPYLERTKTDDVGRQYGEWGPDPAGDGFGRLIDKQIARARSLGAPCIEWDNIDSYDAAVALRVFERTRAAGLLVAVKNPNAVEGDQAALLRHGAAAICIVECDTLDGEDGNPLPGDAPAFMDALRRAAGRPDMPVRFVGFNDPDDGDPRGDAQRCAQAAATYSDIGVTFDPSGGEYGAVEHLLSPRAASASPNPTPVTPMPQISNADIIAKARSYIGKFTDGADVPMLARTIGGIFPDLAAYCRQASNDMPWCGDFVAYVLSQFGIRPAPVKNGVGFFYVDNWLDFGTPIPVGQEQPGDVILFIYPGSLHHVCFYAGNGRYVGGNQSDAVTETGFSARPSAVRRAPVAGAIAPAPDPHPLISLGATGTPVLELQRRLGIAQSGTFDQVTDVAVRAYQSAHGLDVDGEVGPLTWGALLSGAPASPTTGALPQDVIARVAALAGSSALASYRWNDRGVAPRGYIKGMAVAFAQVYARWKAGDSAARVMAALPTGDTGRDALAWYGVTNITAGVSTLRVLFTLLIGLGMRESSGDCYEGRDTSASNFDADTVEAGLFQQSWNSRVASAELPKLLAAWRSSNDDGLLSLFREGLSGSPSENFGGGDGAAFQALCKSKPLFAVYCAGVGLRTIRQHWGPLNRREAEMRPEADALLQQVQAIVDGIVVAAKPIEGEIIPPVKPQPDPPQLNLMPLMAIAASLFMERTNMSGNQPQFDITKLLGVMREPVVNKLFSGGAVTLQELLSIPADVRAILTGGQPAQPALPSPATIQPVADPAPPSPATAQSSGASVTSAPAAVPATTPNWLKNLSGGIAMLATSLGASATGVIGAPIGPEATTTGMLLPLISAGAAAIGIPTWVVNIGGAFASFLRNRPKPAT